MSEWKCAGKSITGNDYDVYRLTEQTFTERIDLVPGHAVLLVRITDELHVDFAVFEWMLGNADDSDVEYIMLLHGSGPSGSLRECRHIWWGENGYTHSLNFAVVEAAFRELRRWFDGD